MFSHVTILEITRHVRSSVSEDMEGPRVSLPALQCTYSPMLINRICHVWMMFAVSFAAGLSFWSQSSKQLGKWVVRELGGKTLTLPLFYLTLLIVEASHSVG